MKLALVTSFPPSSGSLNEYGLHLVGEFAARTDVSEVLVIADRIAPEIAETVNDPKIRIVRAWDFNSVLTPFKILSVLNREKPDGVVYNIQTVTFGDREAPAAIGLFTPLLTRLSGHRSGVLVHNLIEGIDLENTILKGSPVRQRLVKIGGWVSSWAMTRANYLTTTLDVYADLLKSRFPAADVTMVPHGTFARPKIRMKAVKNRKARLVTMGKFGTYKRLGTLMEAFAQLREGNPSLELVIGGADHPNTPGYMAEIERRYADLEGVTFAGYIAEEDVPRFFADAKLAVFDYEATTGSSGVLHQCASYGAVPVFPRIGDFVEMCTREGIDGINYRPGDVQSMAAGIREILDNPKRLSDISSKNIAAVDELPLSKVAEFHVGKFASRKADETIQDAAQTPEHDVLAT